MSQYNILYIKLHSSSFIRKDEELLSKHHRLRIFQFRHTKGFKVIFELLRQLLFLARHIGASDVVYVWFADFHAVLPALMSRIANKKCIIVIGGVDAAYEKEINYGTKTKLLGKISVHLATKMAHLLLPVTQFTYNSLLSNVSSGLASKCSIIYNCFNNAYSNNVHEIRQNMVITVCLTSTMTTVYRKGVDFYLEVARLMPECSFVVVGVGGPAKKQLEMMAPANVRIIDLVPFAELSQLYKSAKVICQFSRYEAFGVALLEGIASGCFPVGFNKGGTAEILTNGAGLLIESLSTSLAVDAINKALIVSRDEIAVMQQNILSQFTCQRRLAALNDALASVMLK